jgi:hypothetical protein
MEKSYSNTLPKQGIYHGKNKRNRRCSLHLVPVMYTGSTVGTTYNPCGAQIQSAFDYTNGEIKK